MYIYIYIYIYIHTIFEENNIQEVQETEEKSSLTIDLLTGLKHSILVQVEDEAFKMYRYIRTFSKVGGRAETPT